MDATLVIILGIFGIIQILMACALRQRRQEIDSLRNQINNPWVPGSAAAKIDKLEQGLKDQHRWNATVETELDVHERRIRRSEVWHDETLRDLVSLDATGHTRLTNLAKQMKNQPANGGHRGFGKSFRKETSRGKR